MGVATLVVFALIGIVTLSVKNSSFSASQTAATRYAQEAIEWLRQERDKAWDDFAGRSDQTWCIVSLDWNTPTACGGQRIDGAYEREVVLETQGASTVQAEVTVSWADSAGVHEARVTTQLTNWRGN